MLAEEKGVGQVQQLCGRFSTYSFCSDPKGPRLLASPSDMVLKCFDICPPSQLDEVEWLRYSKETTLQSETR
jgi:hypothetical protein